MRTLNLGVDRTCTGLGLAAVVAGVVVETACPWPRNSCANGDPALMTAALGSTYLVARAFARSSWWLNDMLEGLLVSRIDPRPADRDRLAEG